MSVPGARIACNAYSAAASAPAAATVMVVSVTSFAVAGCTCEPEHKHLVEGNTVVAATQQNSRDCSTYPVFGIAAGRTNTPRTSYHSPALPREAVHAAAAPVGSLRCWAAVQ